MSINVLTKDDFRPKSFEEARAAFARKIPLTSDAFDRLASEHRRRAFRIATVNNARLVQQARDMLAKAVEDGRPFAEFRRELLALFDSAGVPRPALYRLQLVFRQNVLHAYSEARREVLDRPEITAAFPYRMYLTVGNGTPGVRNVRPEHAALHRKVFRWNDPFWVEFLPPWDYGCRCTFVALTAADVKRMRVVVWTYKGGMVQPLAGKRGKRFALKPHPDFGSDKVEFDLSNLDAELRRVVEENLN